MVCARPTISGKKITPALIATVTIHARPGRGNAEFAAPRRYPPLPPLPYPRRGAKCAEPCCAEHAMNELVTAAMVVIGDEILSGRTKDQNIGHLADIMTAIGIDLVEVRVVADDEAAIVEAVNALRARNTYVFTTGGIGPTHDDITADSISKAFGVKCDYDARAYAMLEETYAKRGIEFTEARKRMARMPLGATHIDNPISLAPGFRIGNVHVMAGVPAIFQVMLDNVVPTLKTGQKLLSESIHCPFGEGVIGDRLGAIQKAYPDTIIGSYPKYRDGTFWTELVVRSRDPERLAAAKTAIEAMVAETTPGGP
jgi:molybdenum cofactor synthesis domain-containing protein